MWRKIMFEHHQQPLVSPSRFIRRQLRYSSIALVIILGSLLIGISGYHFIEGMSWLDSLLNASMILGGMGPVNNLQTDAGKVFASLYALYSGVVFLVITAVLFAPVLHRVLHHFHLEMEAGEGKESGEA
jgi:hypothetical protein